MCGIIGFAGCQPAASREWLVAGRNAMAHRGPDDVGLWWSPDGRVGLGHLRLAIIDLSPMGHQPMHEGNSLTIIYNGEIYNFEELRAELEGLGHSFRSLSDTEVILKSYQQWGRGFLTRLHGMFALALFDAGRQQLLLARDRAGEKPLFYYHSGDEVRFASELKGLLADRALPRRIDPAALDLYLSMGFVPGNRCILQGFAKLPPAHAMVFDLVSGQTQQWRYWDLPPAPQGANFDRDELVEQLEAELSSAVQRQLVGDVPIGVLLSGGVDSSLVTALAARAAPRIRTFNVSFPGHGKHDESAHARLIADHFGTDHEELVAEPASADLLPILAAQFDEPVIDSSMIPTFLVTRAVREHCTVALGGDGGDELFAGYAHHSRLAKVQERLGWAPAALRRPLAALLRRGTPDGRSGRNWLRAVGTDFGREVPLVALYFDRDARSRLLPGRDAIGAWPDTPWIECGRDSGAFLDRVIRTDFRTYLPEDILVKVDRTAMLNSLEVRAPFLDVKLIEFAYGRIPVELKGSGNARKMPLKALAGRLLPPAFDRQRKQGFSVPLADWLRTEPFRALFRDTLLAPDGLFDNNAIASLFERQNRGYQNAERLFGLVQLELWRRHYSVSL